MLLMTDLSQVEGIQLVERVKFQALAEELNLGASGIVDSATAPRVGKLLGASYLVGGDLKGAQAPQFSVVSNLLQVKDQNSLGQPSANGQEEQIFDMEKKILFEIIELLKIKLTKVEKETLKRPSQATSMPQYKAATFPGAEYPNATVEAEVHNSQESLIATGGPWPCDTGEGSIRNIEEGDNYLISISLKDAQGIVIFRGSKGGLQVAAGQITNAGTIDLKSAPWMMEMERILHAGNTIFQREGEFEGAMKNHGA
jgi:hypothetical protein